MKKYKVICKIDKGEGMEKYTIFIKKAKDENEVFSLTKSYMLTEFPEWLFYGTYSITEIK